jgi:MarR family transcriptional regulator, negative regulator of the multidrug operon emrRAB
MNRSAFLLERLGALIQEATRNDAARNGLLPVQLQVLTYLAQANNYSDFAVVVSEYLGLTRGTVSQTLAVLERDGMITKRTDEHHGRRVHLDLTDAGRQIVSTAWSNQVESLLSKANSLANSSAAVAEQLAQLVAALQAHNDQSSFGVCRDCGYFRKLSHGAQCGLTDDALAKSQTTKICREWISPE